MVKDRLNEEKKEENKKSEKTRLPKELSQKILKQIVENLLKAIMIMFYFILLNLAHSTMKQERLIGDIEVFASVFLILGIVFLERAYQKDKGNIAITAIEFLVLSLHSLSIMHVITMFKYDFKLYLLTSSYIFSIYYVLKAIVFCIKGKREYWHSISDISEIVKKEEPVKKEAKKRQEEVMEKKVVHQTDKKIKTQTIEKQPK